jgi:two-component system sensor histidine kinase/response regulator
MPAQLSAHEAPAQGPSAAHLLHTLKGLAATLGATELAAEAALAEKAMADALTPAVAAAARARVGAAIAAASPGLAELLQALQFVPAPEAVPTTNWDAPALRPALQALARLLGNADMAATDAMDALKRQFGAALGARLRPMDEAIDALDFERALGLCNEWTAAVSAPGHSQALIPERAARRVVQ